MNDSILLQAQGQWQMDNKNYMQFCNAYAKNLGKGLADWGYGNSIAKGQGEVNFSLAWDGDPTQFELTKLGGAGHIDMRNGVLTDVNPGLGRVVGLLNIDSIKRRLQLDFSDVLNKGFTFDKLTADLKLQPGNLNTENVSINSPSARIELAGNANLKTHGVDFVMHVRPKTGASLPVAAAIAAGNPAIGAALWLFDH